MIRELLLYACLYRHGVPVYSGIPVFQALVSSGTADCELPFHVFQRKDTVVFQQNDLLTGCPEVHLTGAVTIYYIHFYAVKGASALKMSKPCSCIEHSHERAVYV